MPSEETGRSFGFVLGRYTSLVKCCVGRMFQGSVGDAFVVVYGPVANKLNLRYARDSLEVRM